LDAPAWPISNAAKKAGANPPPIKSALLMVFFLEYL
jgi:hypothetical protein